MLRRLRGVSVLGPVARACGWQEIVEIADLGLYTAKRKGRNGWVGLEAGDTEDPLEAMQRFRERPGSSVVNQRFALNDRAAMPPLLLG